MYFKTCIEKVIYQKNILDRCCDFILLEEKFKDYLAIIGEDIKN